MPPTGWGKTGGCPYTTWSLSNSAVTGATAGADTWGETGKLYKLYYTRTGKGFS